MAEVTREALIHAIHGQESGHGKADTSKKNYAGAFGEMQIIEPTFDGLKSKGIIPTNFQFSNPEHAKKAGEALVGHLFDKYQGDPSKVAAAYYAGEKAVRADGTIADFRDKKNSKAPTTLQYVDSIMKRLGDGAATPVVAPAAKTTNAMEYWDQAMPGPQDKSKPEGAHASTKMAPNQTYEPQPIAFQTEEQKLAAGTAVAQAAAAEVQDSGFIDKAQAAFMHNGVVGPLVKQLVKPDFMPQPGFQLDHNKLNGLSSDEQEYLREAGSPAEAEWIMYDIKQRQDDLRTVNLSGTGVGVAATIFGGLPEGFLTGLGAAKALQAARVGSLALAAEGRMGAAVASSVAENVGGNLAFTAIQDKFDPYVGATDYAMAAGMGLLGVALNAPGTYSANKTATAKAAQQLADQAGNDMMAIRRQAVVNLGPEADAALLNAEVKRLEANGLRQTMGGGASPLPDARRLLPEDDGLRLDVPEVSTKDMGLNAEDKFNVESYGRSVLPQWDNPGFLADRIRGMTDNPLWQEGVAKVTKGESTYAAAAALPDGVHVLPHADIEVSLKPAISTVRELAAQYLPDQKVVLSAGSTNPRADAEIISAGNVHFIGLTPNPSNPSALSRSSMHEFGHAVFHAKAKDIPADLLKQIKREHNDFILKLEGMNTKEGGRGARMSITHPDANVAGALKATPYTANFDEYMAEQFVKHIEKRAMAGDQRLSPSLVKRITDAIKAVFAFFTEAKQKGLIATDEGANEFFTRVLDGTLKQAEKIESEFLAPDLVFPSSFNRTVEAETFVNDPNAVKHGISLMPVDTPSQQAEAKAVLALYTKASDPQYKAIDEKRLSKFMDTSVFRGAQSTANTMLRSDNPVVRMVAAELLESPSGAAGRRTSAAIAKHINERAYLGNTLNDVQTQYTQWRNSQGVDIRDDFFGGKMWEQFNRMVAEEIEGRVSGRNGVVSPPAVVQAADALEGAYERMRVAQTQTRTVGWASLPASSKGYMPHRMSPEKIRNMTNQQADALHGALRDQFMSIEGFDPTFSQNLASKYLDRVRRRALGGFEAPAGIHQTGAADIVHDALEAMGMNREQVTAMMKKYMAGGAGHTKRRLQLDLSQTFDAGDGTSFRLMDLFETDQFRLLRQQAQRVSGEVALARHGIMGKAGLNLLRRAMEFGADGEKAQPNEIEAFDQIAAEFLGDAFGTQSKLVDRVMQVNSLARLGGMGFTQFAEAINGIFHVGAARTLDSVASMPRLRKEIKALAKGEKVENPIIGSLERFGGAEFGTDSYKTVFPFDNQSLEYQTYGKETLTAADRLLRGGAHLQGKLSMWRSIHSTQQRGMAEQIVRKAAQYLQDGGNDVALKDMGISDELMTRLRAELPSIAQFEGGKLTNFDITKATDVQAAEEFTQAIHRGVSQIIQGTFIGETGKWSHDGMMRLMTQFRTFSLTSVEKQWARQRGNVGTAKTLGMMLGAMSLAAPIYMARTYLSSVGREDQEAYLEKQLAPDMIARATLNYIAMSGLAGDFLDATTAVTGMKQTGGRSGASSEFIGNVVAPAAGLVDDVWRGLQNTKEGTDPHELIKTLPFNRLPWMIPPLNALGD